MKANSVSTPDNRRLLPKSITTHSFSFRLSVTQRVFELESKDDDEKNEILARYGQIVFEGFIAEVYEILSPEDQTKIEELIEGTEDPNQVIEFLERRVANFDTMLASHVMQAREKYDEEINKE